MPTLKGVLTMSSIKSVSPKGKTSISVRDMTKMLGLSKVEGYWLVKKNVFETVIAGGLMRVMIDSFNEWYAGQFHYKKVNGEPPGKRWTDTTMSFHETAELLGIADATLYDLLKKEPFRTYKIDNIRRIDKADFNRWYRNQTLYRTVEDRAADAITFQDTFTLSEITKMLRLHRNTVYSIIDSHSIPTITDGRIKRVKKADFETWYNSQNHYKIIGGETCGINHKTKE